MRKDVIRRGNLSDLTAKLGFLKMLRQEMATETDSDNERMFFNLFVNVVNGNLDIKDSTQNGESLLSERFNFDNESILPLDASQTRIRDSVTEKCASGYYKTEAVNCLCGGDSFKPIARKDRYGLSVNTVICENCGLLMTNPHMNQESYNEFYDIEYRALYNRKALTAEGFFNDQINKGEQIYRFVTKISNDIHRVLEIGCGAGGNLMPFHQNGIETLGIDIGSTYLEFGKQQGLNLLNIGSSELSADYTESFDLIILADVLEHFLDIRREFESIRKLLKRDGLLFVTMPGIKYIRSYGYNYLEFFQNAHIWHFTSDTLKQTMNWLGFDSLYTDERIVGLFRKSDRGFSIGDVTNHCPEIIEYMKAIEKLFTLSHL